MEQTAIVQEILDDGRATIAIRRVSACSGDCSQCGGCGAEGQTVTAVAWNPVHAAVGDRVVVSSDSKAVLAAALWVYLAPLVLFFAGYFLGTLLPWPAALWGGVGFALGVGMAVWYNGRIRRKGTISYRIERILAE